MNSSAPDTMEYFICPTCYRGYQHDHRWCLVRLFKENVIKSKKEWEDASKKLGAEVSSAVTIQSCWRMFVKRRVYLANKKPKTIWKGRIRAWVPKE